ncbi:MAG: SpoIID/LytB domain-containing protein [Pyrinomonadaceae bacterium]
MRSFLIYFFIAALFSIQVAGYVPELSPSLPASEPEVRIGLVRGANSVSITSRGSSLRVTELNSSPIETGVNALSVTTGSYSAPKMGIYRFKIKGIETREEADDLAAQIITETGESVSISSDVDEADTETWVISFRAEKESKADSDAFVALLSEKGFPNVAVDVEDYTSPSDDSILLSKQMMANPKSQVRSLSPYVETPREIPQKPAGELPSLPRRNMNAAINGSLREVVVSGRGFARRLESLRAVTIEPINPNDLIYLNGKAYRGKMEVFVAGNGRVTAVNVVPMEAYLLGVVPSELSLPQIEAQKAQAVAARTYAVANRNGYLVEGFDMLPTVWSQVYKGVSIETKMGTQAVRETAGVVASYKGKPINALYTSTCGGRTENSGNIYEFDEPYLRGVDCALEGHRHFSPFLIKTNREPALIRSESNYQYVRLASRYAVNGFLFATARFDDDYFEDAPTEIELRSWLNQLAAKFGRPFPVVEHESSKPLKLARLLHLLIYDAGTEVAGETLMSESDINYQLSFLDAGEVPSEDRIILAQLLRDGWFSIYGDLTIKPAKHYSRAKILGIIDNIYNKKKWDFAFDTGTAEPTEDGKLILKSGRSSTEITVNPNAFLFRKFGDSFYQVKEAALVGGEKIRYKRDAGGAAIYIEVEPSDETTVAENMSPFTTWRTNLSATTLRARLSRYVKGMGALIDLRVKSRGVSKRVTELEIVTTNGVHSLKGGAIRSALRLREQLFVMDKRFGSDGRVASVNFTGRGWGHGIGMCQYGAYGLAKMGVKYDEILTHYYTGVDLVKTY